MKTAISAPAEGDDDGERQYGATEDEEFQQMSLVVDGQKLYIDRTMEPFQYTGERFRRDYPERYEVAVKLLAANQFSIAAIARFVRANPRTIKQVQEIGATDIEKQRAILKQKSFVLTSVLQDRMMELAPDCKDLKAVAVGMGIAKDTYLAVSGLPTAIIEVNHRFDLGARLKKLEADALEMMKQARGRVVEPEQIEDSHGLTRMEHGSEGEVA